LNPAENEEHEIELDHINKMLSSDDSDTEALAFKKSSPIS
jgi:hypothetical protein